MSIAAYAALYSAQLSLELPPGSPTTPIRTARTLEMPRHAALVAAARQNLYVRDFIQRALATWTAARVERNPPCCLVYENGEVFGNLEDLPLMARHAEKRNGMGAMRGLRPLFADEEVLPYNIGLRWGPKHPRRIRWERRIALKQVLGTYDRRAVSEAMRRSRRDFVAWARTRPNLGARVADRTGLTLEALWRAVRGRDVGRPE